VAATLCAAPAFLHAEEFFAVRDENPLVRGFYLPLPSDSRRDAGGIFTAAFALANTVNVQNTSRESLLLDGESDTLRLSYENAIAGNWRWRVTLPLIHDSGGFTDAIIDDWHRWLGLSRGYRPQYPHGQIDYSYDGVSKLGLDHAATSIGDLSADAGWFAVDDAHRTLSFWAGLKAPTGSVSKLTSDGAWDGSVWGHYAVRWTHWQIGAEAGLAEPFGDELFEGHAHKASAFGRVALTRTLGSAWTVRAQLDGQTRRVDDSDLRLTGPSLQLSLGLTRRLWQRWRVQFGFAEDAAVNTAPDITFFLGIHS
jgi:hypothetical protein